MYVFEFRVKKSCGIRLPVPSLPGDGPDGIEPVRPLDEPKQPTSPLH